MIPVTTTWVGKSGLLALPTALYAFVLFMCATSYWLLQRLIIASDGKRSVLASTLGRDLKGKLSLPFYAAAVIVSFYSTMSALSMLTAMAVFWFLPDSRIEIYLREQDSEER